MIHFAIAWNPEYQSRNNPAMLRIAAAKGMSNVKTQNISTIQEYLIDKQGDQDIFDY